MQKGTECECYRVGTPSDPTFNAIVDVNMSDEDMAAFYGHDLINKTSDDPVARLERLLIGVTAFPRSTLPIRPSTDNGYLTKRSW